MRKMFFALAAGLALIGGNSVQADTLDFTVPASNPGASISYAGGATDLVGTGITVTQVTGLDTPLNDLVTTAIQNGILAFMSGAYTGHNSSSWFFGMGAAGGINIHGGVSSLGIAAGSTLLTGTILGATVTQSGNNFKVAVAVFVNTVNTKLANYYGLPGGGYVYNGNFNIGFTASGTPGQAFSSSSVSSGDVLTSVPEPSTMALAGLGTLGLLGYGLRRRKAMGA